MTFASGESVQPALAEVSFVSVWIWGGVLIAAAVGALFVILAIRKRMMDDGGAGDQPWTLQDLRELRENRQISETEYQTLRAQMIASAKAGESVSDEER